MHLFGVTFVSLAADFVIAFPMTDIKTVQSRGIIATDTDLVNLKLFSEWAGSAYCNDDNSTSQLITCSSDVCPTVESHNATIVSSFSDRTLTGMEGYVGLDPVREEIVVALRGSGSVRNWVADLDLWLDSCSDLVEDCKLHQGFYDSWKEIAEDAMALARTALTANPSYKIIVTVHSLGAAVANIAAAYMRQNDLPCDLYTYGSPRVGNQEFVNFLSAQAGGNEYRVTHINDPFARLPPNSWILGSYRHVSPEFWVTQAEGTQDAILSDLTVCEGNNNDDCNSGTYGQNNTAHLWYFGGIAGCAPASITW